MWTIQYTLADGAVFNVTATWADPNGKLAPAAFTGSVNFEAPGSVDDFIACCRKAKDAAHETDSARTKYADVLAKLEAQLNG